MTQTKLQPIYPYLYAFYFIILPTVMEVIGYMWTDTQTVVTRTKMVKERVFSLHLLSKNKKTLHRCRYTLENMKSKSPNMKNYTKKNRPFTSCNVRIMTKFLYNVQGIKYFPSNLTYYLFNTTFFFTVHNKIPRQKMLCVKISNFIFTIITIALFPLELLEQKL